MFCPQCRAEYREGFRECAECGVALVESPARADSDDETWALPSQAVWQGNEESKARGFEEKLRIAGVPYRLLEEDQRYSLCVYPATERIAREVLLEPLPERRLNDYAKPACECPLCGRELPWNARVCPECLAETVALGNEAAAEMAGAVDHPGDARLILNRMRELGIPCLLSGFQQGLPSVLAPRGPMEMKRFRFWVLEKDASAAADVIRNLQLTPVPSPDRAAEFAAENASDLAGEEIGASEGVTVWRGSESEVAEALRFAFRENEIRCGSRVEQGEIAMTVAEGDAGRAREIVRQITEGVEFDEIAAEDPESEDHLKAGN